MQRKRRRLWIWLVSALAVLAIVAATLSALFSLAVSAVPGYRSKVEARVAQAAGHPVQIGRMALVWRSLRPAIELDNVVLLDQANGPPLLRADRLRLGFDYSRLLVANWMPSRAELSGVALRADVDKVGHWTLQGFDFAQPMGDTGKTMDQLSQLRRVSLDNCSLEIRDATLGNTPMLFRLRSAELRHRGTHFDVRAVIDPPPTLAQRVDLNGAFDGDPQHEETLSGHWRIAVNQVRSIPLLAKALPDSVQVRFDNMQLTLDGHAEGGEVREIEVTAAGDRVTAEREGQVVAHVEKLRFAAAAQPTADCWQATLGRLEMVGARGAWSAGQGHYACHQANDVLSFEGNIDQVRLDDVAPWVALAKVVPPKAARIRDLTGDLRMVSVATHPAVPATAPDAAPSSAVAPAVAGFDATATLDAVGLRGDVGQASLNGLSGTVRAGAQGGQLHLDKSRFVVQLPDVFERPLPVDALTTDLQWQKESGAWHLSAPSLSAQAVGAAAEGSLDLRLPEAEGASSEIALLLKFTAPDVLPLKPFIPKAWGPKTAEWLNRAILHARVTKGSLELRGPLANYPFVEHPGGRWALDLSIADVELQFSPDWPAAEDGHADLAFRGHGMTIAVDQATLAGNPVDSIHADIADFREANLNIEGAVHGDAARFYEIVRNSPIHAKLSALVDRTQATGPVKLDLRLGLALKEDPLQVHADGTVTASGAEVLVKGLDQPVRDVAGMVAFDAKGVTADSLTARFYDAALSARIVAQPGVPEGELDVSTDTQVDAKGGIAAAFVPDWIRARLGGTAHVRARMPFGGAASGHLLITSDLVGVASRLPLPLGKPASTALPLTVSVGGDATVPLRVGVEVGDLVRVGVRFADEGAGKMASHGVQVQFGGGPVPRAEAEGVNIAGAPDTLDVLPWLQLLPAIAGDPHPERGSGGGVGATTLSATNAPKLGSVDLRPAHLLLRGGSLSQPHLTAVPAGTGYRITLDGASAQGVIDWTPADEGHLVVRLDHLTFDAEPPDDAPAPPEVAPAASAGATPVVPEIPDVPAPAFDPTHAPTLDLTCERLAVGEIVLGRLAVRTSRIPDGQKTDVLSLDGGNLGVDAHGGWHRTGEGSTADLAFDVKSPDIGPVLGAFGYAKTIDAKQANFSGTLAWPRNAGGLDLANGVGLVKLDLKNGVLKTVKPGAGRVLGLLNLYALPRRLLFDFRDVVSKGLAFDAINGKFSLANGQAYTSDMEIRSPSLKVLLRGRIGLEAHDYDQRVTVYPDVTTGVTIGAGIAGGPVGALIALVAQEALGKPFNKLSKFSYHVTGPWDNPVVKHGKDLTTSATPAADGTPAPDGPEAPDSPGMTP